MVDIKEILWVHLMYLKVLQKCDVLLSVTDEDSDGIRRRSRHRSVLTIPNGVDTDRFSPRSEGDEPEVIFFGNMDFPPNIHAATHFIENIWGKVQAECPTAKLIIAGRNPDSSLKEIASRHENVNVLGFVEDMRHHIGKAWGVVAPMVDGTGIKNKILEAFSMGKPVVATSLAVQGLDAQDGSNIFVSDNPTEFADIVVKLLRDKDLRGEIGKSARDHAMKRFTWKAQAERLHSTIQRNTQRV